MNMPTMSPQRIILCIADGKGDLIESATLGGLVHFLLQRFCETTSQDEINWITYARHIIAAESRRREFAV